MISETIPTGIGIGIIELISEVTILSPISKSNVFGTLIITSFSPSQIKIPSIAQIQFQKPYDS